MQKIYIQRKSLFTGVKQYILPFLALSILFFSSCDQEDDVSPVAENEINTWILKNMQDLYLWTDFIPASPDKTLDPVGFFNSLKYSGDRFSAIFKSATRLDNLLNGISQEAGYEFQLISKAEGSDDLLAVVLYVKNNSPAFEKGLLRGDEISKINGSTITRSNFRSLIESLSQTHTIDFTRGEENLSLSLNTITLKENPNFLDSVYVLDDGTKVGYYVYHFFDDGDEGSEYNNQMDALIQNFRSQGVTELIVDLRYNSGGFISSATNMASLFVKGITANSLFYQREYNDSYQKAIVDRSGINSLKGTFLSKEENIGNSLSSGNIYFIVSSRSASASELVINGLIPYMNPVLIGKTTFGKNVGSISIKDSNNPGNNFGLLPIIVRLSNASGDSDYENGFSPDHEVEDLVRPLKAFGDIEEPMLAKTLEVISGKVTSPPVRRNNSDHEAFYSSIEEKPMIVGK